MKRRIAFALAVLATIPAVAQNPNRLYQLRELRTAQLAIGARTITAWIADNSSKRQEGMMFLRDSEVSLNGAMIFVFSDAQPRSFWMKNTLLSLDIAYLDGSGTVVGVKVGKPRDETSLPSGKPAKYVLEMKKGAFARFGIKVGRKLRIPATVKSKD